MQEGFWTGLLAPKAASGRAQSGPTSKEADKEKGAAQVVHDFGPAPPTPSLVGRPLRLSWWLFVGVTGAPRPQHSAKYLRTIKI